MCLSVCLFVCLFVDTKTSSLGESRAVYELYLLRTSQKSKILASTYLTNVRQGAKKSRLFNFSALLKLLDNIVDPYQKNDYYHSTSRAIAIRANLQSSVPH